MNVELQIQTKQISIYFLCVCVCERERGRFCGLKYNLYIYFLFITLLIPTSLRIMMAQPIYLHVTPKSQNVRSLNRRYSSSATGNFHERHKIKPETPSENPSIFLHAV
jgi:hypothetical protein